jgi:hypothetical protein
VQDTEEREFKEIERAERAAFIAALELTEEEANAIDIVASVCERVHNATGGLLAAFLSSNAIPPWDQMLTGLRAIEFLTRLYEGVIRLQGLRGANEMFAEIDKEHQVLESIAGILGRPARSAENS